MFPTVASLTPPIKGMAPSFVQTSVRASESYSAFAAIPHDIARDRRLHPNARLVVCALLQSACDRNHATASNATIADYVGCDVGTVKRALNALAAVGLIRVERIPAGPRNRTGRRIWLLWRTGEVSPAEGPSAAEKPQGRGVQNPPPPSEEEALEEKKLPKKPPTPPPGVDAQAGPGEETATANRAAGSTATAEKPEESTLALARPASRPSHPTMPPSTPDREEMIARWLAAGGVLAQEARRHLARAAAAPPVSSPAKPLGSILDRLASSLASRPPASEPPGGSPLSRGDLWRELGPGCPPEAVRRVLAMLCRAFAATDSQNFQPAYAQVLERVRLGEISAVLVEAAYREAHRPGIRNRGAAFAAALKRSGVR